MYILGNASIGEILLEILYTTFSWHLCRLVLFLGFGNPTSVDFVATDLHQMVASYAAARTVIFDLETGKAVLNLDSATTYGKGQHSN